MRLAVIFTLLGWLAAVPAAAHDFWIDLPRHRLAAPADLDARFVIGDPAAVEPWETSWQRIVGLRRHGPDGVHDLLARIRLSTATAAGGAALPLATAAAGTHIIAFESNHAAIELPAGEFTSYAEDEGLALPLALRKQAGTERMPGREIYSRRAKALIQIGPKPTADALRPVGHTLEIVPLANPYALPAGSPLVVRVYYHGLPLAGATVSLESLDQPRLPGTALITNARGEASFGIDKAGRWKLNCVWSAPIADPRADYETIFSSLTFGY
jgi:uncharacterized GH25 family protein